MYHNDLSRLYIIGVDTLQRAVFLLDVCIVGTDVHQRGNVAATLAHGIALEQFAHLIEQHHGNGLQIVAALLVKGQGKSTQRGHGHEEVLVEHPAVADAQQGFAQNVVADDEIHHYIIEQSVGHSAQRQYADVRQQCQYGGKHGCHHDAQEHRPLFLVHHLLS